MKSARQDILDNLRFSSKNTLIEKPDFSSSVFPDVERPLELSFKKALELVNGDVDIFDSGHELFSYLKNFTSRLDVEDIHCIEYNLKMQLADFGIECRTDGNFNDVVQIGITGCEFLVAHTGSVMVSSMQIGGRRLFVFPEIHIIIAKRSQLVEKLEDAYSGITERYQEKLPSQIILITGPSRTADIEKTLTLGAHGPKQLRVLLY